MIGLVTLARPYARAAFDTAQAQDKLTAWLRLLECLAATVRDPLMQQLLRNPKYNANQLADVCIRLHEKLLDQAGRNFIMLLAEQRRLLALPDILLLFEGFKADAERSSEVEVCAAVPLTDAFQQRLVKTLSKKLQRQVNLTCHTDETVLGGLLIRYGDSVIDATLQGQLQRLQATLID